MSAESLVRRSLLTATALRMTGEFLHGVGAAVVSVGKTIEYVADPLMYLEAEAARRYKNLTGVDLGCVVGYPDRYSDDPEQVVSFPDDDDEDA